MECSNANKSYSGARLCALHGHSYGHWWQQQHITTVTSKHVRHKLILLLPRLGVILAQWKVGFIFQRVQRMRLRFEYLCRRKICLGDVIIPIPDKHFYLYGSISHVKMLGIFQGSVLLDMCPLMPYSKNRVREPRNNEWSGKKQNSSYKNEKTQCSFENAKERHSSKLNPGIRLTGPSK